MNNISMTMQQRILDLKSAICKLIEIKQSNVISTNPFDLLAARFAYYPVRIIKPFYYL